MRLTSIRLKNYKAFKDTEVSKLPCFCCWVGANGTGKTSLFNLFKFLKMALTTNVNEAVDELGGFAEVQSREAKDPIEIELCFENMSNSQQIIYNIEIDVVDEQVRVLIESISWRYGKADKMLNCPLVSEGDNIFYDNRGHGRDYIFRTKNHGFLNLPTVTKIDTYAEMIDVYNFLNQTKIFTFDPTCIREGKEVGNHKTLASDGSNLRLVLHHLHKNHPEQFNRILTDLNRAIPGMSIEAKSIEGRVLLRFHEEAFVDPFLSHYVSDGTLLMLAYLTLIHAPNPYSLICIEEPENHLHHALLVELAEAFRSYSWNGGQVFISTHSPEFLNAASIEQVFWLEKEHGYTKMKRAKDDAQIVSYMADGDKMGWLWKEGLFGKARTS